MKVYLAGKISGDPDYKKKFHFTRLNIKKALRILSGNEELFDFEVNCRAEPVVLNPADLPGRMAPADYMKICFAMIDCSDFPHGKKLLEDLLKNIPAEGDSTKGSPAAQGAESAKSMKAAESSRAKANSMEAASAAILENVLRRLPDEGEDTVVFRIL